MVDFEAVAKWIGIATVILAFIWRIGKPLGVLLHKLNEHLKKAEADELGLRTLLKWRLTVVSKQVLMRKGITVFERAILQDGLKSYEGLGGNGEVGALTTEALRQPLTGDKDLEDIIRNDVDFD